MSAKRQIEDYLYDIRDSVNDIRIFVGDMTCDEFVRDRKTVNAVIRSLEVIGDAAKIFLMISGNIILICHGKK
jgi:uncharacterized protein with HEPN domain